MSFIKLAAIKHQNKVSWRPYSRVTWRLPFLQLLHQGVGEGATPFPGLLHFILDPYLIMLSVKQGDIRYHLVWLDMGLNMCLPGHWQTHYHANLNPKSNDQTTKSSEAKLLIRQELKIDLFTIHLIEWY